MKKTSFAVGLALALLSFALLAGCGTTSTPSTSTTPAASPTGAVSQLCQRLADSNQALGQLAGIGDNTTVGDVKAAQQKLTTALNALSALPLPGGGDALNKIKAANDQLTAAIKDMPDSATVGETGPRLSGFKDTVGQAQTAVKSLASAINCTL